MAMPMRPLAVQNQGYKPCPVCHDDPTYRHDSWMAGDEWPTRTTCPACGPAIPDSTLYLLRKMAERSQHDSAARESLQRLVEEFG